MPRPPHRFASVLIALPLFVCGPSGCEQYTSPRPPPTTTATPEPVADVQEGGALTLTIDGAPLDWPVDWSGWLNTDDGDPDGMEVNGDRVHLTGSIDADADGDRDADDKVPYDEREEVMGAAITGKRITLEGEQSTLTLPDGRQFGVEAGTITITAFERGPASIDRVTADVSLTLRLEGRARPAVGTLTTSVIGVW